MKTNRVAITGMGAVCGLGHDLKHIWNGLIEGRSGISFLESPNVSPEKTPVKIAGQVKNFSLAEEILSAKDASKYDTFLLYSLKAAHEALTHAGLLTESPYLPTKMGAILGVGMGGFPVIERTIDLFNERGERRVSPFFIPSLIPNMASGILTIRYGFKGVNYTTSSACASASHAISNAFFEIQSGRQDVVISGGSESVISNLPFCGFNNMKALSKNLDPLKASRPFDKNRDGFVMGEGAGILILENLEKAKARGATIYAEIVGMGYSSDAHHITAPHPTGEGASECMNMAIEFAGIHPEQIGYINAHGTSTPLGDVAETLAIKKTFKDYSKKVQISSSKSMSGHLLGAAGGFESIVCVMALHESILPPTVNLDENDLECDLDYIPNKARRSHVEYALNNSFGFGGTNSSLIFKKYI
ncbi:MAG: beta-ketoacyl-ACP synthase II [Bacteriovoracales bacterium]